MVHILVAVIYTTPWDNDLAASGVWTYDPRLVRGWLLGWVPFGENTFFVIHAGRSKDHFPGQAFGALPTSSEIKGDLTVIPDGRLYRALYTQSATEAAMPAAANEHEQK
jgi:hypothetical protein